MATWEKVGGLWLDLGGAPAPPGGSSRDSLVAMVDKPGPTNTGPYELGSGEGPNGLPRLGDGTFQFTDVFPNATQTVTDTAGTVYVIPVCNVTTTTPQIGKRYWGVVKWSVAARFYCCAMAGPDPTTWPIGVPGNPSLGCTQAYGSGTLPIAEFWDCELNPAWWLTSYAPTTRSALNPYNIGHHGGNVRFYRTEFNNVSDGVNFIGPNGSAAAANAGEFLLQQSWLHHALYDNDLYPPSDGQPHCDGFQVNYGKNWTLRGNTIGGDRDKVGYLTWPGGYNSGDDFWNSGLLFKQETNAPNRGAAGSSEAIGTIEHVLVEGNWLGGGSATINHTAAGAYPGSWADTVIRNNRFRRRLPGWEQKMSPSVDGSGNYIPHSAGIRNDSPAAPNYGWYVLRPPAYSGMYTGNVFEDTGLAVTISNGV